MSFVPAVVDRNDGDGGLRSRPPTGGQIIELMEVPSGLIGTDESCWGFPPVLWRATVRDAYRYQHFRDGLGQGSA